MVERLGSGLQRVANARDQLFKQLLEPVAFQVWLHRLQKFIKRLIQLFLLLSDLFQFILV